MRRALTPLATLAMLALIVAGCSNASGGAGSSGGDSTAAAAGSVGSGTAHERAVEFAQCMRANGIGAFPDPDASGKLTIDGIANGSSVDTSSAAFEQALSACKDLEPPGFTGTKVTPQQRTARLKFAQCMRDNGVKDFPDPANGEPLVDTTKIPSLGNRSPRTDPVFAPAMDKCRVALEAALRDRK